MEPKSQFTTTLCERARRACDEAEELRQRAAHLRSHADELCYAPRADQPAMGEPSAPRLNHEIISVALRGADAS